MNSRDWKFVATLLEREADELQEESRDARKGESPSDHARYLMRGTGAKKCGEASIRLRSMAKTLRTFA